MNTNALELDYFASVPDFTFMYNGAGHGGMSPDGSSDAMQPFNVSSITWPVVFMPCCLDFRGVEFCLHAHSHTLLHEELFEDGIPYIGCAAMKIKLFVIHLNAGRIRV